MTKDDGYPYSVNRGSLTRDGFLLTHCEWHPCSTEVDRGQPETGIRRLQEDGSYNDFELVQHRWWDFDAAEKLILKALKKGWRAYRINRLMDFIAERNRIKPRLLQYGK